MELGSTRVCGTFADFGRERLSELRTRSRRSSAELCEPTSDYGSAEEAGKRQPGISACGMRARRDALTRVQLRAMAVEFPEVHGHPNRLPFEGVLTLVDVASDKAPSGSRGHRVVLTREAAEAALPSLLGMAVGYKAGWDGHDARQKCGIITAAELDGRQLMVKGFLFARDFRSFIRGWPRSGRGSSGEFS